MLQRFVASGVTSLHPRIHVYTVAAESAAFALGLLAEQHIEGNTLMLYTDH
jgi:hypothetical protein